MVEVTTGRKYAVRMMAIPRIAWSSAERQAERQDHPQRAPTSRV